MQHPHGMRNRNARRLHAQSGATRAEVCLAMLRSEKKCHHHLPLAAHPCSLPRQQQRVGTNQPLLVLSSEYRDLQLRGRSGAATPSQRCRAICTLGDPWLRVLACRVVVTLTSRCQTQWRFLARSSTTSQGGRLWRIGTCCIARATQAMAGRHAHIAEGVTLNKAKQRVGQACR